MKFRRWSVKSIARGRGKRRKVPFERPRRRLGGGVGFIRESNHKEYELGQTFPHPHHQVGLMRFYNRSGICSVKAMGKIYAHSEAIGSCITIYSPVILRYMSVE